MAFWSKDYDSADLDPKRGFRFKVMFAGVQGSGDQGLIWWAKKVTKPSFDVTESKHTFLDKHFYYPGRLDWQTVSLTLVDPVSPIDAVAQTNALIEACGYKLQGAATEALVTMSKGKATAALGDCKIIQLDAAGEPIETWTLKNPFIKNVKYGELSYESDDLVEIELEIRYDWATCDTRIASQEAGTGIATGTSFFGTTGTSG